MRWIDDGFVEGWVDDRFAAVAEAFQSSFRCDPPLREHGAMLAVTFEGRPVVDLWGGFEDEQRTSRLRSHALIGTFSAIKAMVALSMQLLVERGLLDLDRPIAEFWPAFAANGKEGITARHVLSHTAGLQSVSANDFAIPLEEGAWLRAIENATPLNPIGAVRSYHALSLGQILGEVIKRVTGRSARTFLQEEVCDPLAADSHIGVSPATIPRVCALLPPTDADLASLSLAPDDGARFHGLVGLLNSPSARTGVFPFGAGYTTARGFARIYGALALGGAFGGVRICSEQAVRNLATLAWDDVEQQTKCRWRMAQGVMLSVPPFHDYGPSPLAFGHAGAGGTNAFADPGSQLSFAYLPVRLFPAGGAGLRGPRLIAAVYGCLERLRSLSRGG